MTVIAEKGKIYDAEKESFPSYIIRTYFRPRFEGDIKTIDCSGLKDREGRNLTSEEFSKAVSDELQGILSGSGYRVFADLSRFSGEVSAPDIVSDLIDCLGCEPEKIRLIRLVYGSSETTGYRIVAIGNDGSAGRKRARMQLYGLR
jgi:hypothetical protein